MVDNNITPQLVTVDVHRAFDPYEVDAATGLYRLENGQKVVKPEAEFKKSKEEATAYLKSWYETVYLPAFPNIEEREDVESWISRLERQAGKLEMPGFKLAISIAVDVSVDPAAVAGGICGEAYPGGTMLVAYTAKNPDYTRTGVAIRALAAEGITAEHSGFEAKLAERREAIAKPFDMSGLIAHAETEVRDMMKFQGVEGRGSVWELDPLEGIKWARVADRASLDAMRAKIEKADVALPELDEAHLRFPLWVNEEDGAMSSMDPAERVKAAARNGFSVELPVRHVQPPLGVGQESVPLVLLWHGESLSKDVMGDVARWQYDYYAALLPEKLVAGETRDEIFLDFLGVLANVIPQWRGREGAPEGFLEAVKAMDPVLLQEMVGVLRDRALTEPEQEKFAGLNEVLGDFIFDRYMRQEPEYKQFIDAFVKADPDYQTVVRDCQRVGDMMASPQAEWFAALPVAAQREWIMMQHQNSVGEVAKFLERFAEAEMPQGPNFRLGVSQKEMTQHYASRMDILAEKQFVNHQMSEEAFRFVQRHSAEFAERMVGGRAEPEVREGPVTVSVTLPSLEQVRERALEIRDQVEDKIHDLHLVEHAQKAFDGAREQIARLAEHFKH